MGPTDVIGGDVKLYRADCLAVLAGLPDGAVSAVITDPPYGIALADHDPAFSLRKRPPAIAGDGCQGVGMAVLEWAARGNLPTAVFGSPELPWPGAWRNRLVWDKGPAVGRGGDPEKCWKRTWELIQVARNGPLRRGRGESVLRYYVRPDHFMLHPAAKPVPLMEDLIEQMTDPGDVVLDPFMGSGSTGVAALRLNRRFLGVEIDPAHYATALARLRHASGHDAGQLFSVLGDG
jgi:DNA modification methylase